MVPGLIQGMSRVRPDPPEQGVGGRLNSEGLWGRSAVYGLASEVKRPRAEPRFCAGESGPPESHPGANAEFRMQNAECGMPHNATAKPPQSVLIARGLRPQSHPKATLTPP